MKNIPEKALWHAWASIPGMGAARLSRLAAVFPTLAAAWEENADVLLQVAGLPESVVQAFVAARPQWNVAAEYARLEEEQIVLLTIKEEGYPPLLRAIPDPPAVLYCRGNLELLTRQPSVAIVGTRRASPYGRRVAMQVVACLAGSGVVTVSGLAHGIDSIVHQQSLAFDMPTIAVLGCGVRSFQGNGLMRQRMFAEIGSRGLVITEFDPDTPARPAHFPLRNRIISGLCPATVVIEAPAKSGALLTAASALEQNRDVIAVPGPIDQASSAGANALIRDGAQALVAPTDLLSLLDLPTGAQQTTPSTDTHSARVVSPETHALLKALRNGPCTFDTLLAATRLPLPALNATVVALLLAGKITEPTPQTYALATL